jgi:hypothetical protein
MAHTKAGRGLHDLKFLPSPPDWLVNVDFENNTLLHRLPRNSYLRYSLILKSIPPKAQCDNLYPPPRFIWRGEMGIWWCLWSGEFSFAWMFTIKTCPNWNHLPLASEGMITSPCQSISQHTKLSLGVFRRKLSNGPILAMNHWPGNTYTFTKALLLPASYYRVTPTAVRQLQIRMALWLQFLFSWTFLCANIYNKGLVDKLCPSAYSVH